MSSPQKPILEFLKPSEIVGFNPPANLTLVGDNHVVRGNVTVIGGAPGVGKSRAAVGLAVAGATGDSWFGLTVHRKFKTLIIQSENGRSRLSREFADLAADQIDEFVRITPPPPLGLTFNRNDFSAALRVGLDEFKPDVVVIDPWNAVARDDKAKDFLGAFEDVRRAIPAGDDGPALVIVAHTRKPADDERTSGRGLLKLLAGSYVLGSVPRCVFVMQAASDDPTDDCIVWTCCKNNDGELGQTSAWFRRNGLFELNPSFDLNSFLSGAQERRSITKVDLKTLFDAGHNVIRRSEAVRRLEEATGCCRAAAYSALATDGKFKKHLVEDGGFISWKE